MKSAAGPATLLYDKVNDNNGTMYNGTCFDFDGTDDLVLTSDPIITGTGDFTLTAWINRATVNGTDFICGNYGTGVGNVTGVEYYGANNGGVRCYIGGSNVISATTMVADTWYHVVVTRTSGTGQLYINGVADGAAVSISASIVSGLNFAIGNGPNYASENFDGIIADVKAFDIALSAANIKELYDDSKVIIPTKNAAAGGFVSQTNLIGWWPLAEGAGDICYDGSGKGYHGIVSNEDGDEWLTGQTGAPQLVEGYNRAMLFEGNDGAIKDVANYRSGDSSGTMAAWVNFNTTSAYQVVVGSFDFASGTRYIEIFTLNNGMIAFAQANDDTADYFYYNSVLAINTWHHVAVTSNGSSYAFYVNGAEVTKTFAGGSDTGDWFAETSNRDNICVGILKYSSSYGNWMEGLATEVVVYNTPLSAAQISTLATRDANGAPLPPLTLPAASNVVGYWRYDSNVTWTDLSSGGNDLTVTGSPPSLLFKQGYNGRLSTSTGRDNQGFPLKFKNVGAVGFNGSNDYIKVLAQSVPELENIFDGGGTASAWVYAASDGETSIGRILHKRDVGLGWRIECRDESGGFIRIRLQYEFSSTDGRWETAVNVPINQWVYVCVTYDSDSVSNDATIYINGVSNSSESQTPVGTRGTDAAQNLYIGNRSVNDYTFDGQIANAQLYNRALTNTEIKQNFAAQANRFQVPRGIVTDRLVLNLDAGNPGSYPGSGTAWYDVSGNGCDFTLDGSGITYSASNGGIFTLADGGAEQTAGAQIASSTNSTVVIWMYTTDGQALFWDRADISGSYYVGAYRSGNKEYYGTCGTPDFYMDTVAKSNIYDYFPDGNWHMVEFKNVNLSSWSSDVAFNRYGGYQFGNGAVGKIMIYNRTISAAESAQNFRVDRERFGI